MVLSRILVILVILTCVWRTGETTYHHGPCNTDKMADEYNNLLNVDTGYSNSYDDIKKPNVLRTFITQKEITESTLTDTRATVYGHLLCSYVFTCRYYMNMIRILVDGTIWYFLKQALREEIIDVTNFQNQIINMFSVLKHLGTVKSLDPLWLTYVYLECLKNNILLINIKQSDLFSHEHDIISNLLTHFTDKNCHQQNMYNHQYDKSDYFKLLQKFNLDDDSLESTFVHITESAKNQYSKIKKNLNLRDDELSFSVVDLRLHRITLNNDITETLLEKFAEAEDWQEAQLELHKQCFTHNQYISVPSFVKDVAECQAMFVKIIKYIIARTVMKYVHDVHLSLPFLENGKRSETKYEQLRSREKLALRISQSNIKTTNETMLNNYKEIVSFLKIDQDEDLKFVAELLNTEPDVTFSDPKKNIDNETRIKNIMENCSKGVNDLLMTKIPLVDPDLPYKGQRKAQMLELAELHKVEVNRTDGHEYEGMLDLFVLKSYIVKQFVDIDFDIAHSFFEFSERI